MTGSFVVGVPMQPAVTLNPEEKKGTRDTISALGIAAKKGGGQISVDTFRQFAQPTVRPNGNFIPGFWFGLSHFITRISDPERQACLSQDFLEFVQAEGKKGQLTAEASGKLGPDLVCREGEVKANVCPPVDACPSKCEPLPTEAVQLLPELKKGTVRINLYPKAPGDTNYKQFLPVQISHAFVPWRPDEVFKLLLNLDDALWIPDFDYSTTKDPETGKSSFKGDPRCEDGTSMIHYFRMTTQAFVPVQIQAQVRYTEIRDYGKGHYRLAWETGGHPSERKGSKVGDVNGDILQRYEVLRKDEGSWELWAVVEQGQVIGTYIQYRLWTDPDVERGSKKWGIAVGSLPTFTTIKIPELFARMTEKLAAVTHRGKRGEYKDDVRKHK